MIFVHFVAVMMFVDFSLQCTVKSSVVDPHQYDVDPDPRIRIGNNGSGSGSGISSW